MVTGTTAGPAPDGPDGSTARPRGVLAWGVGRTVAFIVGTSVLGALLMAGLAVAVGLTLVSLATPGVDADGSIDGLLTFDDLSLQHVEEPFDYVQTPPVGGPHLPVWQDCGFYDGAVVAGAGVHSLEHGAVWVTYDPDLPEDQVADLRQLAADNPYLLVSPVRGLPAPVVASAWGVQVRLRSTQDERLPAFLVTYQQGPQTPEPGAPCSGGLTTTASQASQV